MKIQFIIHADFEMPGIISSWALDKGFQLHFCRSFAGEELPKATDYDWLIVMGGPQTPLRLDLFPYLQEEIQVIRETLALGKVVLGFCLGAQLIGESLGARTEKSPHKEVGVFPVELTSTGKQDPLLHKLSSSLSVVHWHSDMPGLTSDAEILATSAGCPRQIIRYTEKAYGFQCHLEPTLLDMQNMILHCEEDLKPGLYVQSKEELLRSDFASINQTMIKILDTLLIQTILHGEAKNYFHITPFVFEEVTIHPLVETPSIEIFLLDIPTEKSGPGLHLHHTIQQTFYPLSGNFTIELAQKTFAIGPQETCSVPPSTPHRWHTSGVGPWKILITCIPSGNQISYLKELSKGSDIKSLAK